MRKVLVTGGCGYIGSHVARAFKNTGDTVHIVDVLRRDHTLQSADRFILNDFSDTLVLEHIVDFEPDIVVHCAGTSLVAPSMVDPEVYYFNNVGKTLVLMNILRSLKTPPLLMFSSSASVYGEPKEFPITESHAVNPISPYGNTKAIVERIMHDYSVAYGIPSIAFRYFNAAGAEPFNFNLGQAPGATHIVARVLEASLAGRAFTINGDDYDTPDGTCIRDYVHVWDIAQAHVRAADLSFDDKKFYAINLGTETGISNYEIVRYVDEKYKLPFVNYGPRREGDPSRLIASNSLAKEILNWTPEYSTLSSIVDSAYKWYTR